jgi:hypothetical protein
VWRWKARVPEAALARSLSPNDSIPPETSARWHSWHLNRGRDGSAAPPLPLPIGAFISARTMLSLGRLLADSEVFSFFIYLRFPPLEETESKEVAGGDAGQDSTRRKTRMETADPPLSRRQRAPMTDVWDRDVADSAAHLSLL